ncbi:MAG: zinc-binding dehydrogenase [Pseudomonadota bacterium]
MRAAVFHEHGDLENVRVEQFPDPEIGEGECLLKVKAVSLNGFDPMVLRRIPGLRTPLPMIFGADVSAEIVELGEGVDTEKWQVGQRVGIEPSQHDGMMGETKRGGLCEFVSARQEYLVPIPDGVSDVQAACLPTAYGTAHRLLHTRAQVREGETILILGATGGVGTCCVQLANLAGCQVIACASSSEKAAKLTEIGADHVIDTSQDDFVEWVIAKFGKPRTRGHSGGVDVCVNYIGGESWARSFRTVKRGGRIVTCGATTGYDPKTDLRYIWSFEYTILGANGWQRSDHEAVLGLIEAGRLDPAIHAVRPMDDIRFSLGEMIKRQVFGKSVLVP